MFKDFFSGLFSVKPENIFEGIINTCTNEKNTCFGCSLPETGDAVSNGKKKKLRWPVVFFNIFFYHLFILPTCVF